MNNKEKVELLKKYFTDEATGGIDLGDLNFGDLYVNLSYIKGGTIDNSSQQATEIIYNSEQEAPDIINGLQVATDEIWNNGQRANKIVNHGQVDKLEE